jgi:hypothetical protein
MYPATTCCDEHTARGSTTRAVDKRTHNKQHPPARVQHYSQLLQVEQAGARGQQCLSPMADSGALSRQFAEGMWCSSVTAQALSCPCQQQWLLGK